MHCRIQVQRCVTKQRLRVAHCSDNVVEPGCRNVRPYQILLALYGIGRSKQVVEQDFIAARKSQRSRNADVEGGVLGNLQTARAKSWQESNSRGGTLVRIKTLARTTTENQIDPECPCRCCCSSIFTWLEKSMVSISLGLKSLHSS